MTKSKRTINIEYCAVQALYWAGFCACSSFAAVFLKARGFSNAELGLVMAAGNILGFFLSPLLASYVDRVRRRGLFACCMLLFGVELALVLSFYFVHSGAFIAVGYCIYMACVTCVNPLNTQLCFTLEEQYGHINYGAARSIGSLGFAAMSSVLGAMVELLGTNVLLSCAGILILLQATMLALLYFQSRGKEELAAVSRSSGADSSSIPRFVAENRLFIVLLLGISLLFFSHNLINSFMINLTLNVGGSTAQMGVIHGFMAFVEVPAMIFYDKISRRLKCASIMRFAAVMFTVKALAYAMAQSVAGLYAACLVQGLSFALITPACVHYVNLTIDHKDSAKGQSLAMGAITLGNVFACSIGGLLYDKFSVFIVLMTGVGVAALGAVICLLSIKNKA